MRNFSHRAVVTALLGGKPSSILGGTTLGLRGKTLMDSCSGLSVVLLAEFKRNRLGILDYFYHWRAYSRFLGHSGWRATFTMAALMTSQKDDLDVLGCEASSPGDISRIVEAWHCWRGSGQKTRPSLKQDTIEPGRFSFLLVSALAPMLFFTLAGNTLLDLYIAFTAPLYRHFDRPLGLSEC